MPESQKVATLLRMFRYIRPDIGEEPEEVAESHQDLGLLTIVVGSSAGLNVFEPLTRNPDGPGVWIPIESMKSKNGELTATLLGGRTLGRFTNGIYHPGRHRVFVHPATEESPSPYRFSLVFALRAHFPGMVSSKMLTTEVTGPFKQPFGEDEPVKIIDMYRVLTSARYNINIDKKVREQQRKQALESRSKSSSA